MYLIYILILWALSRSVRSQHLVHRQWLMNLSDNSDLAPRNFLFCELGIPSALPVSQDSGKYEIRLFREISCVDLLSTCCSVQSPCRALAGKLQRPLIHLICYEASMRKWLEEFLLIWLWSCSTLSANVKTTVIKLGGLSGTGFLLS